MNNTAAWISRACASLGLNADLGFSLTFKNGQELHPVARILTVGAPNGMLVVRSYEDVRTHADEIVEAGYGYSVLDEPRPNEAFDLESFQDMFSDWGWCGDEAQKPGWMP